MIGSILHATFSLLEFVLSSGLFFLFGVLFGQHNKKTATAIEGGVASVGATLSNDVSAAEAALKKDVSGIKI